jgi:hypothetical protein
MQKLEHNASSNSTETVTDCCTTKHEKSFREHVRVTVGQCATQETPQKTIRKRGPGNRKWSKHGYEGFQTKKRFIQAKAFEPDQKEKKIDDTKCNSENNSKCN